MTTEALTRVDPSQFDTLRDAIRALDAAARAADGHDSLGDSVWRDLARPAADSIGFLIESRAYAHVSRAEGETRDTSWTVGIVQAPDARNQPVTTALLEAAITHVAEHGGRDLTSWVFGATEHTDAAFAAAGFAADRGLYEMRTPLPVPDTAKLPPGIEVRSFDPDRDASDWLRVNNLAFAGHAEQGGWDDTTLRARMAEPWFDTRLFLLAFDAHGLAGFNWLKQHDAHGSDPALGEIYVIGVDPRVQGTGLGRALALAGLTAVHAAGSVAAMLFVAADNAGAIALYRSLGFSVHRTDRAYTRAIAPRA